MKVEFKLDKGDITKLRLLDEQAGAVSDYIARMANPSWYEHKVDRDELSEYIRETEHCLRVLQRKGCARQSGPKNGEVWFRTPAGTERLNREEANA